MRLAIKARPQSADAYKSTPAARPGLPQASLPETFTHHASATMERIARWKIDVPPPGCWNGKISGPEQVFTDVYREEYDCDCHIQGACPSGEPSMPPLWEFMDTQVLNDPWSDLSKCPPLPPLPAFPQRQSWKEQKHLPPWLLEQPELQRRDVAVRPRLTLVDLLDDLPAHKQAALRAAFADDMGKLEPCLGDEGDDSDDVFATARKPCPHLDAVDPALVLSILLADPSQLAGSFLRSSTPSLVRALFSCTERAIRATTEKARHRAAARPSAVGPDRRRRLAPPPPTPLPDYLDVLEYASDIWAGGHASTGNSQGRAMLAAADAVSDHATGAVSDHAAVCARAYELAVANVEKRDLDPARYVSSYMRTLDHLIREQESAALEAQHPAVAAPLAAADRLDWRLDNVTAALGMAVNPLTVAMGFFTLSSYLGASALATYAY